MKTSLSFFSLFLFTAFNSNANEPGKGLIDFKENLGQVHDQNNQLRPDVLFSGCANGMVFHLKNSGVSYQLSRVDSWKEENVRRGDVPKQVPEQTSIYRIDESWINANLTAKIVKGKTLAGYENFYTAAFPNGITNVKSYEELTYKQIYNGIDLRWYNSNGSLEYDYIIGPGANYKQIQTEIKGAQSISIDREGNLIIETPFGTILEQAPLVKQEGKTLKSGWVLNCNVISFDIKNVDPAKSFVIDPYYRVWGTYYGGSGYDMGMGCAADASGNVYLSGKTDSGNGTSIATGGSHQTTFAGGAAFEAFVAKFDPNGARSWATYYSATGGSLGNSVAVDGNGNVFMAGSTSSTVSISSGGSHQTTYGGSSDAYLVKFNSSGVRQWGTYYGGTQIEYGYSCATDASGNVYLAGTSQSTVAGVISTSGAHQSVHAGQLDAFLVKFNSSGVRQWATYYGDTGIDEANACATDASGNVYLAGDVDSGTGTVIATSGSHQSTFGGGWESFLVKFNSSGVRQWGTYYGGVGTEYAKSCVVDGNGDVFLAGMSGSPTSTAIATSTSHQPNFGGGTSDAFLTKFSSSGVRQWGTYYGGSGSDVGYCATVNSNNDVYLSGSTGSNTGTVIATTSGFQNSFGGGALDGYLVLFNGAGNRIGATYYGGSGDDNAYACAAGPLYVNIAGYTDCSTVAIIASGIHQNVYGGGTYDGFLAQFSTVVLGITEEEKKIDLLLNIFPNPNAGEFTVTYPTDITFLLVNELGQTVKNFSLNQSNDYKVEIKNIPVGIYFVTGQNESEIIRGKIIVAR